MKLYEEASKIFYGHKDCVLASLDEIKKLTPIQRFSVNSRNKSDINADEEIAKFRENVLSLVNNKVEHTKRGVCDIEELFKLFPSLSYDYVDLAKTVELFHDIGRFMQAIETGTHVDGDSYNVQRHNERGFSYPITEQGITDHGRHGAHLLVNGGLLNQSKIPYEYWEVIYNVVKYHMNGNGKTFDITPMNDDMFNGLSTKEVATEKALRDKFLTLYFQTVKAVDDFDLHNKILNGEIPILGRKTFGLDVNGGDSVAKLANRWGIAEEQLRETNKLESNEELETGAIVRIDPLLVPQEKFQIADDYADMYYTDTLGTNLPALQNRNDYTFLNAQIFRLSTLRNISFLPILQNILDSGMLDKMFELYPDKYKPIMEPFFDYAKKETTDRIEKSPSKIYVSRTVGTKRA